VQTSVLISAIRRALIISVAVHIVLVIVVLKFHPDPLVSEPELVDIEIAPTPLPVEALPEEVARMLEEGSGSAGELATDEETAAAAEKLLHPDEYIRIDAGMEVDAPIDAPPDAPPDARIDAPPDARPDAKPPVDAKPDAPIDAPDAEPTLDAGEVVAQSDAGGDDGGALAVNDAGGDAAEVAATLDAGASDAGEVASTLDAGAAVATIDAGTLDAGAIAAATIDAGTGSAGGSGSGGTDIAGTGSGSGTGSQGNLGSGSIAMENGSGSGVPGQTNEPAVDGAPTTAGTAANLLAYFPKGHVVTALIRFDRLRGTEWAAATERLLHPMPDYQVLFGTGDAKITEKLDTLIISTPRPRDAAATTLVGRTSMERAALREFLSASTPITWSGSKGGLLGKRTGRTFKGDQRVFLSPYKGWFFLAQPDDIQGLTVGAKGDLDAIEAKGKLPPWLAGMRDIEKESNGAEPKGPSLVVTLQLPGERIDLQGNDFGLGIKTFPTPTRVTLAMELVKQGWLAHGNMTFSSERAAKEFVTDVTLVKQGVADSYVIKKVLGKPVVRVIDNLSFARTGGRVSYSTSVSIGDARSILNALGAQLDVYFDAQQPSPASP
jgi:hypothetical protein